MIPIPSFDPPHIFAKDRLLGFGKYKHGEL